ncbi:MAG: hypothetical protein EBS06_03435 [Proteobacteria bacterium]|nr:hypothetical protein [Pseudomonadota bacterium]
MVIKNNNDKNSNSNSNVKYHSVKELISGIRLWVAKAEESFSEFSEEQKSELFHEIGEAITTLHLVEQWIEARAKNSISSNDNKEKI